jgi:sugar transferase (PEP-CTERM system associated)
MHFFRHYIPANILLLFLAEVACLILSVYAGVAVRFLDSNTLIPASLQPLFPKALVFASVMIVVMSALGLYTRDWMAGIWYAILRLIASFVVGLVIMGLVFYLFPDLLLGRGAFLLSFWIALAGMMLTRYLFFKWSDIDMLKQRVLVLGTGSRAAKVEAMLQASGRAKQLQIVGYLPLQGTHHYVEHSRVLNEQATLTEIVKKYDIDEIVIAIRDRRSGGLPVAELLDCKLNGISVIELSTFFERENGQLQLESLNASWVILSDGFRQEVTRDVVKRVFDLIAGAGLMLASLPIMLVTAALIVMESSGPIFYRQERVGHHGKSFTILKFRSMRTDAEQDGKPKWAGQNDDRVTRVGRVIRKIRVDELPQVFNVLTGHMSFVGPRPERPFFVDQLAQQIPYYNTRHSVKPGITGWAQVRYAYGASVEDAVEKLQYDLYYVKNHSLFMDIMVLFQTAQVVLWGKGAR